MSSGTSLRDGATDDANAAHLLRRWSRDHRGGEHRLDGAERGAGDRWRAGFRFAFQGGTDPAGRVARPNSLEQNQAQEGLVFGRQALAGRGLGLN